MSEPTKEAIEEATPLLLEHAVECFDGMVMSVVGLAHIIAHVRKQARDDALEGARLKLESMRAIKKNVAAVTRYQFEHDEVIDSCITALDALKDKPDGVLEFDQDKTGGGVRISVEGDLARVVSEHMARPASRERLLPRRGR